MKLSALVKRQLVGGPYDDRVIYQLEDVVSVSLPIPRSPDETSRDPYCTVFAVYDLWEDGLFHFSRQTASPPAPSSSGDSI